MSISDQPQTRNNFGAEYRESYPRSEERLNAATHAVGALLSVFGLVFLIIQADTVGRPDSLPAVIAYGVALVLLFSFSALHHAALSPRIKHLLLGLDHNGIYLLIAGTYTPFCLLMPRGKEWTLLSLVWGLAMLGIAIQVIAFLAGRSGTYERFAYLFYLALGWIPMFWAGDDVFRSLAPMGFTLLVAGGAVFTVGVVFYLWKHLPYGHVVWHLFVVAGCGLHFFSILHYVVPETI